jgi:hypothetical protein
MIYILCILVAFVWGVVFFHQYQHAKKRTATAQGTVLRVRYGPIRLGVNVKRPEIEFVDSRGQRHEFHCRKGASWNPWPAGSTVEVFYDPDDPSNAEIKSTIEMKVFTVVVGGVMLGAALYSLWRH